MARAPLRSEESLEIAPYFDQLLERLQAGDPTSQAAFGRHVHWGYWPDPSQAQGSAEDYAAAAERLCRLIWEAAGIGDGMRVLDVGCGIGGTIASLNECFHDLELIGLNIDPRQLQRAADTVKPQNGNRIRFVEGDACKLAFPAASFDAVLAVECIFHFDSRADFLRGAAQVLRPQGRLALSDFVPPREVLPTLRQYDPGKDEATRRTYGRIDVLCPTETYRELADAVGLTLLASRDVNAQTMPTYAFLLADLRSRPDRKSARVHARATARLEMACQMRLLQYTILSFVRRALPLAQPA